MSEEVVGWLIRIGQFILSLSILITLHEMGHYLAARTFKTKVEKFFLFFDYKFALVKKKIGDTVYGIGWIPLGGYVKIAGMVDESMDKEQMAQPPQPWEYRSKPAWQRLIIITAGVIVNLILGVVIFSMSLFIWGSQYVKNESLKDGIHVTDSLGTELGFMTGDRIVAIDGKSVEEYDKVWGKLLMGSPENVTIQRNGQNLDIALDSDDRRSIMNRAKNPFISLRVPFIIGEFTGKLTPAEGAGLQLNDRVIAINDSSLEYFDQIAPVIKANRDSAITLTVLRGNETIQIKNLIVSSDGSIGVGMLRDYKVLDSLGYLSIVHQKYGFLEAIPAGFTKSVDVIVGYARQFAMIFNPSTGAYKHVGGFKSIAGSFLPVWDWQYFWNMTAVLSLVLAFMNILPIPALDGGHMVFILWEMVTRRKPNEKLLERAQIVGFFILIALMLFANLNDWI